MRMCGLCKKGLHDLMGGDRADPILYGRLLSYAEQQTEDLSPYYLQNLLISRRRVILLKLFVLYLVLFGSVQFYIWWCVSKQTSCDRTIKYILPVIWGHPVVISFWKVAEADACNVFCLQSKLNRNNDKVYESTTSVVRAVMTMTKEAPAVEPDGYLTMVRVSPLCLVQ